MATEWPFGSRQSGSTNGRNIFGSHRTPIEVVELSHHPLFKNRSTASFPKNPLSPAAFARRSDDWPRYPERPVGDSFAPGSFMWVCVCGETRGMVGTLLFGFTRKPCLKPIIAAHARYLVVDSLQGCSLPIWAGA